MALGQDARLAGLGIVIGLAAAFAATRMMAGFWHGVDAADPLLVPVALLASYLLRASRHQGRSHDRALAILCLYGCFRKTLLVV